MYCLICCNDINESPLACSHCKFEACFECHQKFITSVFREPSCMSCNQIWSREFVMQMFPKRWVKNVFIKHIGYIVMERERLLLPQEQDAASKHRKIRDLHQQLAELNTIKRINRVYKKFPEERDKIISATRHQRVMIMKQITQLKNKDKPSDKKQVFIMRCPYNDCRGFVAIDHVCGTCKAKVCNKCHMPLTDTHVCKSDDISSAELIKNDSKPCPNCVTSIFKISGCNQMFCTQCHIAFDWITGQVEKDVIMHNPHYFEWLQSSGINQPCNGGEEFPHPNLFFMHIEQKQFVANLQHPIIGIYRNVPHILGVLLPLFEIKVNKDLRINYLLGDFDDKTWASKLANREKKNMKTKAFRDLLNLYIAVITDMVWLLLGSKSIDQVNNVLTQYKRLVEYHKDAVKHIVDVHGGDAPANMQWWRVFTWHM